MTLLLLGLMACGEKEPTDSDPVVTDEDGDGYDGVDHGGDDCDDSDSAIHPDADEVCDDVDNNCDGTADEDSAIDADTWYQDADADGYGSDVTVTSCTQPSGYVAEPNDCDDSEALSYPGNVELCDEIDNNCNGAVDEVSAEDAPTWYTDNDDDGFGDPNYPYTSCEAPEGYVADSTDCDDTNADTNTDGVEVCDGADNDCDGTVDEDDASDALTWWVDADGDGHGVDSASTVACDEPSGFADNTDDCDDTDGSISPDGIEICDEVDNDCDGTTDEPEAIDASTWYYDADNDSYGDAARAETACVHTAGYVNDATDCDDDASGVNPGATESCNDIDDDCDGTIDEDDASDALTWYADDDSDGYGDAADSTNACTEPSGYVSDDTDCDDTEATTHPGADEICEDSVDNDCDSTLDECAIQGDLDGTDAWASLLGETAYDYAGTVVAGLGDVDGDGDDDFAVGAPGYDASSNEGRVYVFYGATSATSLASADVTYTGDTAYSGLGLATSIEGGDLTGDGTNDLVLGAESWDGEATNGGAIYLYAGGALSAGTATTPIIKGSVASGKLGSALAIGDINDDGYDDLLAGMVGLEDGSGTPGGMVAFLGPISAALNTDVYGADIAFTGTSNEDEAGVSLAWLGDTNGDGVDDWGMGAHYVGNDAGAAYLVMGPVSGGTLGEISASSVTLSASASEDLAGRTVAAAGDVDGDGYADTLVTAPFNDDGATDAGAAYIVYGPTTADMSLSSADVVLTGEASSDNFGWSAAGLDTDGDGYSDVAVGAYRNDDGGSDAGASYLWYGPISAGSVSASSADADITGASGGDQLGYSLDAAGDLDGDGFDDLILGARRESTTDTYSGAAYLFLGDER
jgi:hypothetical protein